MLCICKDRNASQKQEIIIISIYWDFETNQPKAKCPRAYIIGNHIAVIPQIVTQLLYGYQY